ncbi:hypothetical protein Tco_0801101 [Tanacetum coccineum]|uniref:Uncharacterized protein n=1 Tax=Tanacetum coccineum TaxID=301880 RepID=A0ABQ4ZZD8_9ASTR
MAYGYPRNVEDAYANQRNPSKDADLEVQLMCLAAPTIAAEFSALALRRMIRAGNMAVRCTGYLLTEKISGVLSVILPHPLKTCVSSSPG